MLHAKANYGQFDCRAAQFIRLFYSSARFGFAGSVVSRSTPRARFPVGHPAQLRFYS